MKILVLNGSPKKSGTVSSLLHIVTDNIDASCEVEWVNIMDLSMKACRGCMKCRDTGECLLPLDDAHRMGEKIKHADALIIGTPVYWGNMNGYLKILFDRNVALLMKEQKNGMPVPLHKGKKAIIVTACSTPWPFNFIARESRGALTALKEILKYSGYKIVGRLVKPGTKTNSTIAGRVKQKAKKYAKRLVG